MKSLKNSACIYKCGHSRKMNLYEASGWNAGTTI